jgi:hypothetical protein
MDALLKVCPVNAVAISQQVAWGLIPRKGFDHLLRGPQGGGMLGDVKMDDPSAMMGQDQ